MSKVSSAYLPDTLVIRYKSLLKDVQRRHVNTSLKQTHTSRSVLTTASRYEGVRKREWQQASWNRDGGGGDTEEDKRKVEQCLCVSHQSNVVQFLLLSHSGNNYQQGCLPGQLALFLC